MIRGRHGTHSALMHLHARLFVAGASNLLGKQLTLWQQLNADEACGCKAHCVVGFNSNNECGDKFVFH